MGIGDGTGNLRREIDRAPDIHGATRKLCAKRLSLQELERNVDAALMFTRVEERDDVGMREGAQSTRCLDELETSGGLTTVAGHHSDGYRPANTRVASTIQLT